MNKALLFTLIVLTVMIALIFSDYGKESIELIVDKHQNTPPPSVRKFTNELLTISNSDIDFIIKAAGHISLTYISGNPKKHSDFNNSKNVVDESIRLRVGQCGYRDLSLRRLIDTANIKVEKMGRVNFYNIPAQINHSATYIVLNGVRFFIDSSIGAYFTSKDNSMLSLKEAREKFPNIYVNIIDRDFGRNLTWGSPIEPDKSLPWVKFHGSRLLEERIGCWYKNKNRNNSRMNCDILRTYFSSDSSSDLNIVFRFIQPILGRPHYFKKDLHVYTKAGFVGKGGSNYFGLKIAIPSTNTSEPRGDKLFPRKLNFYGKGLDRMLIDYDDNSRLVERSIANTKIDTKYFQAENRLEIEIIQSEEGGVLTLRPLEKAKAKIESILIL